MDSLTPCTWTFQIYVTGPPIWTTQEHMFRWSKYISIDGPNGRSSAAQLDGPNIRSLTVQIDGGPMDHLFYGILDSPNRRRSHGPPLLLKSGWPLVDTMKSRLFDTLLQFLALFSHLF